MSGERSLARLMEGLRAIAEGDLRFRLDSMGPPAAAFNRMAERLWQAQRRSERERREAGRRLGEVMRSQEQLRGTLEEKVRERTGELQRAYEELKKIDTMKDSFISSVSHELRTPLSSIRSFSEILLGYDEDPETRREFVGIIKQESERLTRLIDQVLDLSRIEAGGMVFQIDAVSVPDLCRRALDTIGVLVRNRGQRLEVDVPEDLPEAMGDPDRVVQVLTNLLSNAVKFTPAGGRILLQAGVPGFKSAGDSPGVVTVMVADDGAGIPPEEIATIFEKFKQLGDTLTDKPRGTGLGLPISREIVRRLGGTMWATSVPGEGSRFHFTLPLARARDAVPAPVAAGRIEDSLCPHGRWAAIADDDPGIVAVLTEMLKASGYGVVSASNGQEALQMARSRDLDLMLLDLNMPLKSGWKVLEALRADERTKSLPVIVLTGEHTEMDRTRALALGALEFLEKGHGLERLMSEIDLLLQMRRP